MLCVTPGSLALRNAFFGQGTGAIFLDDANCSPQNHSTLIECFASIDASVGDHDCQHREDASVVCSSDCELIFVLFGGSCSMEGGGGTQPLGQISSSANRTVYPLLFHFLFSPWIISPCVKRAALVNVCILYLCALASIGASVGR